MRGLFTSRGHSTPLPPQHDSSTTWLSSTRVAMAVNGGLSNQYISLENIMRVMFVRDFPDRDVSAFEFWLFPIMVEYTVPEE